LIEEEVMADEQARDRNQEQEKGKAMGAGASGNYQPDQRVSEQQLDELSRRPNESAGQGGGVQGTGQSQSNPGGFSQGQNSRDQSQQRDEGTRGNRNSEGTNKGR
jgi:hypothetical protein